MKRQNQAGQRVGWSYRISLAHLLPSASNSFTPWRYGTSQTRQNEDDHTLFIDPGTATGAYIATTPSTVPSFVLMDIDGSRVGQHHPPTSNLQALLFVRIGIH